MGIQRHFHRIENESPLAVVLSASSQQSYVFLTVVRFPAVNMARQSSYFVRWVNYMDFWKEITQYELAKNA